MQTGPILFPRYRQAVLSQKRQLVPIASLENYMVDRVVAVQIRQDLDIGIVECFNKFQQDFLRFHFDALLAVAAIHIRHLAVRSYYRQDRSFFDSCLPISDVTYCQDYPEGAFLMTKTILSTSPENCTEVKRLMGFA